MTGHAGTADLKRQLARATRRERALAFALVLPLLAFVLVFFVAPIGAMLMRGIHDPVVAETLPRTAIAIADWDGEGLPGEPVFAAMAADLSEAFAARTVGRAAQRLNFEKAGLRSLVFVTARELPAEPDGSWRATLIAGDPRWGERATWAVIARLSQPFTLTHYLAALDLRYDADGAIVAEDPERQIYVMLLIRTLWISALVTLFTALLGYPLAYMMAHAGRNLANLMLLCVLLPFWTSLLVRTTSWIALLQSNGIVNDALVATPLFGEADRMQLIHNQTGTLIAMTHILLPFMVLPLYSVMRGVPGHLTRAAVSLGASPLTAFRRVYFPQTLPGLGAGALLVFILAMGYYITPALVGGRTGQLVSNMIAYHLQTSLNWGLAAALSGVLLAVVLALYALYARRMGADSIRLG